MAINIMMMKDSALEKCRVDSEELTRKMFAYPDDASWLATFVGEDPFEAKKFAIPEFELKVPATKEEAADIRLENALILHDALKDVPAYILGDMHFWAWVTFTVGYKYAQYRSDIKAEYLKNNWVTRGDNARRSVMLQTIGMNYFVADLANSGDEEHRRKLTEYLFNNQELYRNLVYRNISDISAVSEAVIEAFYDYEAKTKTSIPRETIRAMFKFISNLGSVRLIDSMSADDIYERVMNELIRTGVDFTES